MKKIGSLIALTFFLLACSTATGGTYSTALNVKYGTATRQSYDRYLPSPAGAPTPAIIFIHGGGYTYGDKSTYTGDAKWFAARGWAAFNINYRLGVYPQSITDTLAVTNLIRANAVAFNIDTSKIAALGDSAGGTLAADEATFDSGSARVKTAVNLSGIMDYRYSWLEPYYGGWMGCSLAACPDRYAYASPNTRLDATDASLYLAASAAEDHYFSFPATISAYNSWGIPVSHVVVPGSAHGVALLPSIWPSAVDWLSARLGVASPGCCPPNPTPTRAVTDAEGSSFSVVSLTGGSSASCRSGVPSGAITRRRGAMLECEAMGRASLARAFVAGGYGRD